MGAEHRRYDYEHTSCGEPIRIETAITADDQMWCPNCKRWFDVPDEVVKRSAS